MSAWLRDSLIALSILVVGLAAVCLEVEEVRCGARVRQLLLEKEASIERLRRLEIRYNRVMSPDLLEKTLPEEFTASSPPSSSPPALAETTGGEVSL